MVHQVARLVANVIVVLILAGHDHLACLLGDLLEQFVLDVGQKARRIALFGRRLATSMNRRGQALQSLTDIAILHVSGTYAHA